MNIFKKIFYTILSVLIACLPIFIFLGFWRLLIPETFWQKLILIVLGIIFLLPVQVWCIIVAFFCFGISKSIKRLSKQRSADFENRLKNYKES